MVLHNCLCSSTPAEDTISVVEDLRAAFGRRIRELRQERRFSQEALAERAHLHWTYVSSVERGLRTPGLDVIGRLAAALRVSPSELFRPFTDKYFVRLRRPAKA
jgi:transcriptional regulator with XRE-family HTH domain